MNEILNGLKCLFNSQTSKIKRSLAFVLSLLLVFTSIPMNTYAANANSDFYSFLELQVKASDKNYCDTTVFEWVSSQGASEGLAGNNTGNSTVRFDFNGVRSNNSYNTGNSPNMKTTYNSAGYPIYVGMAPNESDLNSSGFPKPPSTTSKTSYITKFSPGNEMYADKYNDLPGQPYASPSKRNGLTDKILLGGFEFEMRVSLEPSPDNQYIFVNYDIANVDGKLPAEGRTVFMGSSADVYISNDDSAALYKNSRGFHMVSDSQEVFDLITADESLGVTVPDITVAENYNTCDDHVFTGNNASVVSGIDSGLGYSWRFKIRPYEHIHRRVAFQVKNLAIYVSAANGSDSNTGHYAQPVKTIAKALEKVKGVTGHKGYIYIQDYEGGEWPADGFDISNCDATIVSSDYDRAGTPLVGTANYIQTLKYTDTNKDKSLFNVGTGGKLTLLDIVIDGDGKTISEPTIKCTDGNVFLNRGSKLQNITSTKSIVDVAGNANLELNNTKIQNNVSKDGAIYFAGNQIGVKNENIIFDNKTADNVAKNIYLKTGKEVIVFNSLQDSKIGITLEDKPEANVNNQINKSTQERVVAKADVNFAEGSEVPFIDNFKSDENYNNQKGTKNDTASPAFDNSSALVFTSPGHLLKIVYKDKETEAPISLDNTYPTEFFFKKGDKISISGDSTSTGIKIKNIDGRDFVDAMFEPVNSASFVRESDASNIANVGEVQGTMPDENVEVSIYYKLKQGSISFDTRQGKPDGLEPLKGKLGTKVIGFLISPSRYGYNFDAWYNKADDNAPEVKITALPDRFSDKDLVYYAKYIPNPNIKFNVYAKYVNENQSIVFGVHEKDSLSVESALNVVKDNVPGYKWKKVSSYTQPSEYKYDGLNSESIGMFKDDNSSNRFEGSMPAADTTITFVNVVDRDSGDSAKFNFNVIHETEDGQLIKTDTSRHFAEEQISAEPDNALLGYVIDSEEKNEGFRADDTRLVNACNGDFNNHVFTANMPNQDVTIKYIYKSNGLSFKIAREFIDKISLDDRTKHIVDIIKEPALPLTQVNKEWKAFYGYEFESAIDKPSIGAFDAQTHNYNAVMPNEHLKLVYGYNRDASKWKDATFTSTVNGHITKSADASRDLEEVSVDDIYKASILISDGSPDGNEAAFKFRDIKDRFLLPNPVADKYYRFNKWFVDDNNNNIKDDNENYVEDNQIFTDAVTICAEFVEKEDEWYDIKFVSDSHGTLLDNSGVSVSEMTAHLTYDTLWASVVKPDNRPIANFLYKAWYDSNSVKMTDDMGIKNNETYIVRFKPDADEFYNNDSNNGNNTGNVVDEEAPDGVGIIAFDGSGRISSYNTTDGYRYILTDLDGNIIDTKDADATGRVHFDNLYPENRYNLYESLISEDISNITHINDVKTKGNKNEVLVPVIYNNFDIRFDNTEEDKTIFEVYPADTKSKYALVNENGEVVKTSETDADGWQETKNGKVYFSNLEYNKIYKVVAKDKNSNLSVLDRLDDAMEITTDAAGKIDKEKFILQVENASIVKKNGDTLNVTSLDDLEKGDQVTIKSDDPDFKYFSVAIGSIKNQSKIIKTNPFTFTMPNSNLVIIANNKINTLSMDVSYLVKGSGYDEISPNFASLAGLVNSVKTSKDAELININKADIRYNVLYNKNKINNGENEFAKTLIPYRDVVSAYEGAFAIDVSLERFVNERKVKVANNNIGFNTLVQLDKEHIGNLDYNVYEVATSSNANGVDLLPINIDDPENTSGFFNFDANFGKRYIVTYSKAYPLIILCNTEKDKFKKVFRVRKGDNVASGRYAYVDPDDTGAVNDFKISSTEYDGIDGYHYTYLGLSSKEDKFEPWSSDSSIEDKTFVYAYFENNADEVNAKRKAFQDAIDKALKEADDFFLKKTESDEYKAIIRRAIAVLDQTAPRKATLQELEAALSALKTDMQPYSEKLNTRYTDYKVQKDHELRGGSGGGGGGRRLDYSSTLTDKVGKKSMLNPKAPLVVESSPSYYVGTNGSWKLDDPNKKEWSFVLNGGIKVKSRWAQLEWTNGDAQRDGWYHFNKDGVMNHGWFKDETGSWYYCNKEHDGFYGKMKTTWHYDKEDTHWYYLDPFTGRMQTGWQFVDGKWYYFAAKPNQNTYEYKEADDNWQLTVKDVRPYGSMYKNEITPDGYKVGPDGAYIK